MRTLRPAILLLLLTLALGCSKKTMPASTYKDTAASFDQFAQELVTSIKDDKKSEFDAIVSKLSLTDPKGWFDKTFGPEAGPRLYAEYEANPMKDWKRGWAELRKLVVDQGRDPRSRPAATTRPATRWRPATRRTRCAR